MDKPEILYPRIWHYKIIGADGDQIKKVVPEVLGQYAYEFRESKKSSSGKYVSFEITMAVESEEERNRYFNILKNIPTVKMVL